MSQPPGSLLHPHPHTMDVMDDTVRVQVLTHYKDKKLEATMAVNTASEIPLEFSEHVVQHLGLPLLGIIPMYEKQGRPDSSSSSSGSGSSGSKMRR